MSLNNKPQTLRNSWPPFRPYDAHEPDIASGRVARSGLGARHPVWLQQLDIALRHSNRIRHLHRGLHSESRDFPAAGFSQNGPIEADDPGRRRRVFVARRFLLFRSARHNRRSS